MFSSAKRLLFQMRSGVRLHEGLLHAMTPMAIASASWTAGAERVRVRHGIFLEEVEEEFVHVDDASRPRAWRSPNEVVRFWVRTVRPILRVYLWRGVFGLVDDDPARDGGEH